MYSFFSPYLFFAFIIINFLVHLPVSFSAYDSQYSNCARPFNCGNIRDISYPFWGHGRDDYCGLPGYELKCEGDTAEIEIESQKYRILDINKVDHRMKIATTEPWNENCPSRFHNESLPSDLFKYIPASNYDITLFYGCPSDVFLAATNKFSCSVNDTDNNYFWADYMGPLPRDLSGCNVSVIVHALQALVRSSTSWQLTLQDVLNDGFDVEYVGMNVSFCNRCEASGGQCGYDADFVSMCFCHDRPYRESNCTTRPPKGSSKGKKALIGVGTGIGGVFLTCVIFFIIYQRRKRNKLSSSSTLISRDISRDLSSKQDLEKGSIYFKTPIFSYKELDEATNHFDSKKELGDGGFGTVYHGKLRDGRVVAIKRLFEHNYKRVEQFMNEIQILSRLRHQNLVSLYGCTSQHSRELLLVYEYVPNGTVADHLHGDRAIASLLTWPIRMSIAIESADALTYLHASDIIHRDVKTNNILLDNGFHVKVADFGLSRLFPMDVTHVSTAPQGTPGYVDPEYYQCYQLNDRSDVYSFGVVLIELISSKPAVDIGRHRHEINLANMAINKIQTRALHELVDPSLGFESDYNVRNMITLVAELAFRCLQQEKEMRPCMVEVLEILRGIESEEYKKKTDEMDISADARLLKNSQPLSPDSVTAPWVSKSSTPNTSG